MATPTTRNPDNPVVITVADDDDEEDFFAILRRASEVETDSRPRSVSEPPEPQPPELPRRRAMTAGGAVVPEELFALLTRVHGSRIDSQRSEHSPHSTPTDSPVRRVSGESDLRAPTSPSLLRRRSSDIVERQTVKERTWASKHHVPPLAAVCTYYHDSRDNGQYLNERPCRVY